jgi:hypothetical protein
MWFDFLCGVLAGAGFGGAITAAIVWESAYRRGYHAALDRGRAEEQTEVLRFPAPSQVIQLRNVHDRSLPRWGGRS